jgi:large subunit ribosomal protein L12
MEYIYAALLLDSAGKEVNEAGLESIVKAAGIAPNEAMAKAVVSSLKGVNIKEVVKNAQTVQVAAAPVAAAGKVEAKKEEVEKVSEEQAAGGLASLFG